MPVRMASVSWRSCLHVGAGDFARDPALVVVGGGDLAVEGEGGFQGDQRLARAHEVDEGLVQLFGFRGEFVGDGYGDAGRAQGSETLAGDERVGILHGGDYFGDAGGDDRFGAGGGAALVRAGFEIEVERRAAGLVARLFQRVDFCVLYAGVGVEAASYNLAIAHDHGADHRVGTGLPAALPGQVERFA